MQANKYTTLRLERKDNGIAEVIFCRPEKLNSMIPEFWSDVGTVFQEIDKDPHINVVIIWAEGRLFTSGLDLSSFSLPGSDGEKSRAEQNLEFYKLVKSWQGYLNNIHTCKKPVIACVHSHCIGGGIDLITACDIRLCTEDARFVLAETKVGLVADVGTLQRLTPLVGKGFAREMAFTAEGIGSRRAHHFGLVNEVYADKEAMLKAAREMATKIGSLSPLVVQGTKVVMNYSDEHSLEEGLEYVALWNSAFIQSDDLIEAMTAFLQKRKPVFKNRL